MSDIEAKAEALVKATKRELDYYDFVSRRPDDDDAKGVLRALIAELGLTWEMVERLDRLSRDERCVGNVSIDTYPPILPGDRIREIRDALATILTAGGEKR